MPINRDAIHVLKKKRKASKQELMDTDNRELVTEGSGEGRGEGVRHLLGEGDRTLGGGHSATTYNHGPQTCTLETFVILLPNVAPIHFT